MPDLNIHVVIYAEPSLRPHEAHVALSVEDKTARRYYVFHVTEDLETETEMRYEMQERDRNPLGTRTPHQQIQLSTSVPESKLRELQTLLEKIVVPRPKPVTWNCQTWLYAALVALEQQRFMNPGAAAQYYAQMMQVIAVNATAR